MIPASTIARKELEIQELRLENEILHEQMGRQLRAMESLRRGTDQLRMKSWHSMEDMHKAEAILYEMVLAIFRSQPHPKP